MKFLSIEGNNNFQVEYQVQINNKGVLTLKPNEGVVKIGLLGSGTVGGGVIQVLQKNADVISQRAGVQIQIKKVLIIQADVGKPILEGLNTTFDYDEILNDPEIKIVVELIGGIKPAKDFMLKAMEHGKHVVTANKDVIAQFGKELFETAEKFNVEFAFEASVGGGIPIIRPLKESLIANHLTEVLGIVNGTTNYMLTQMSDNGADYDTVLKEAQSMGYAEANPAADVEGFDAARKAAILASLAFNSRVTLDDVYREGITKVTPSDIEHAKNLGYVVKLLAVCKDSAKGIEARVHPVFLKKDHPLASVNGVLNAIFVRGDAINQAMFFGPGAGSLPTASAVVSDIMNIARNVVNGVELHIGCTCFNQKSICPIEESETSYYIRLLVDDEPGVLGSIATAFGNHGVSLKSVVQTDAEEKNHAEIVVITHKVKYKNILDAQESLKTLKAVDEIKNIIRVESD